jgi:hypothetical protein
VRLCGVSVCISMCVCVNYGRPKNGYNHPLLLGHAQYAGVRCLCMAMCVRACARVRVCVFEKVCVCIQVQHVGLLKHITLSNASPIVFARSPNGCRLAPLPN